jgi:hypothetical protein
MTSINSTNSNAAGYSVSRQPAVNLSLQARLQPSSSLPALQAAYQARIAQLAKPFLTVRAPIGPRPGVVAPDMTPPKPAVIGEDGLRAKPAVAGGDSLRAGAKPVIHPSGGKLPGVIPGVIAPIDSRLAGVKPGIIGAKG